MTGPALKVLAPKAFSPALEALATAYAAQTGRSVDFVFGPASGTQAASITSRLAAGEAADLALLPLRLMDDQVRAGLVQSEGLTPVLRSSIGMCVAAGQPVPDISNVAALRQVLLQADSIALSTAGSGVYVAENLLATLGVEAEVRAKCRISGDEPVGQVVARGGASIGFQQVSELLPVSGITCAGPLPEAVQLHTDVAAGVLTGSHHLAEAQAFMAFLQAPHVAGLFTSAGLTPLLSNPHPLPT